MSMDAPDFEFRPPKELHIDYKNELNPEQLAAVEAPPGPCLVIAGAGSGKTRTLTYRVAYLLEQGIHPDRILLLTFTNKAASEMMRRVFDLLQMEHPGLWGGTFHSIGNRLLRRHAEVFGLRSNFTILDREDADDLLKSCMKQLDIDPKETDFPKAETVGRIISMAANTRLSITDTLDKYFHYLCDYEADIDRILKLSQERKLQDNVLDFDDLLLLWLRLLEENDAIREKYQRQFQFILVDEYQDTNRLQSDIINTLAARHHNVMAVGDDSQSIYAWRGANYRNILDFPKQYPNTRLIKIETNYRSTPEILNLANQAISANLHQFEKNLKAIRSPGVKPRLVVCPDTRSQAAYVAQGMLFLRSEGIAWDQMAVLYRSHFHAMELQMELKLNHIPFTITSGIRFFEQAHIKDITAFLRLLHNPKDEVAFRRLATMLPGVGVKAADKLWMHFTGSKEKPSEKSTEPYDDCIARLKTCVAKVSAKTKASWENFCEAMADASLKASPSEMIQYLMGSFYHRFLEANYDHQENRKEDINQLMLFAAGFSSLADLLGQLALLSNTDASEDNTDEGACVRLSTVHQAKGLEFSAVFVIMLCEGLFPSIREDDSSEKQEEERRLFYVAVTRAKDRLFLCYPNYRAARGYMESTYMEPSRFLSEIDTSDVETLKLHAFASKYHH